MTERQAGELPPIGVEQLGKLLSKSAQACSAIIVGSQALNIWAVGYNIRPAHVMVSRDVDLYARSTLQLQQGSNGAPRSYFLNSIMRHRTRHH